MARINFLELHCNAPGGATVKLLFQNETIWGPNFVSNNMISLGSIQRPFSTNGSVVLFDEDNDIPIPNGVTHPPTTRLNLSFNAPSGSYTVVCDVSP